MDWMEKHVTHTRFGEGVVQSCENGVMQICFSEYGARSFHYPEAFEHFLETADDASKTEVEHDLGAFQKARETEALRIAEAYRQSHPAPNPVKPAKPKTVRAPKKPAAKKA